MILLTTVKLVGQVAVSIGVGTITKAFIKTLPLENATKLAKVAIKVGGVFIGGALALQAGKKWNRDVDNTVNFTKKIINKIKKEGSKETEKEAE